MENAIKFDGKDLDVMGKFTIFGDEETKYTIKDLTLMAFKVAEKLERISGDKEASNNSLLHLLRFIKFIQDELPDFKLEEEALKKTYADNKTILPDVGKSDSSSDKNPGSETILESNNEGIKFDQKVAVIDFHNGEPETAMILYGKAREDGMWCRTPKISYEVFISKLNKKQRKKWKSIKGQLELV